MNEAYQMMRTHIAVIDRRTREKERCKNCLVLFVPKGECRRVPKHDCVGCAEMDDFIRDCAATFGKPITPVTDTPAPKKMPPAVRRGAKVSGKNYTIKSKTLRRMCRGLKDWEFAPRNEQEELALAAMFDAVSDAANEYARVVAMREIGKIGRKD